MYSESDNVDGEVTKTVKDINSNFELLLEYNLMSMTQLGFIFARGREGVIYNIE